MILADVVRVPEAPPSLGAMVAWYPQGVPLLPVVAVLAAVAYAVGLRRIRRIGRVWPWWRPACFFAGCAMLFAVTGLAIEGYGQRLFSAWMFQHLTLSIAIPPLLVLGSPGVLLLRTVPHHGAGRWVLRMALGGLRSRAARILLSHATTISLFLFSYYGVYLTPIVDVVGASTAGHLGLEVFFLASGILFIVPVLSTGPLPVRQTNLGRFFDLFLEMPLHAFFGVIIMMATSPMVERFAHPPAGWGVDPMSDQQLAGALAWSYGEPVAFLVVIVFAIRWRKDEERSAAARERENRSGDEQLAAYNAYLAGLRR